MQQIHRSMISTLPFSSTYLFYQYGLVGLGWFCRLSPAVELGFLDYCIPFRCIYFSSLYLSNLFQKLYFAAQMERKRSLTFSMKTEA